MKLRQKTLLLVVLIYTPLVVLVSLAVRGVVLRGHLLIEQQQVSRNARRLLNTFSYELDQLEKFVRDWASWDDTREFVRGLFPEYVEANLMDETFLNSNLGYFVLLDTDWNVIYERHYDEEAEAITEHERLSGWVQDNRPLLEPDDPEGSVRGVLNIGDMPIFLCARHVLSSRNEGPSSGVLLMGRFIDEDYLANLRTMTELQFDLFARTEDAPAHKRAIYSTLRMQEDETPADVMVVPQDGHVVCGFALLPDLGGENPMLLHLEEPRDIYRRGVSSVRLATLAIMLIGLVFVLLLVGVLERVLVSRMLFLSSELERLSRKKEGDHFLPVDGGDELGRVVEHINLLIETLAARQHALSKSLSEHKEAEQEIRRAKEQLNRLTRHLQDAREEEQTRIARRMHDELGQELMALKIAVKWLDRRVGLRDEQVAGQIRNMLESLGRIEACVNNIATELKPSVLDTFGLKDAIEWLMKRYSSETTVRFHWRVEMGSLEPDRHFSSVVFRILQEGIINILRHADATDVRLIVHVKDHRLVLLLSDNGVGIDPAALDNMNGFGLMQMKERAESLGGVIVWQRGERGGTNVSLSVPLLEGQAAGAQEAE